MRKKLEKLYKGKIMFNNINDEIHYLGQMLTATMIEDKERLKSISKRIEEIALDGEGISHV